MKSRKYFLDYIETHRMEIFITAIVIGLVHGSRLFTQNVSIDTILAVNLPDTNINWLQIGRWGLVLAKWISGLSFYNPYFAGVLSYSMMLIASILWSFLLYFVSGRDRRVWFLFGILFFTHPVFALQFFFQMQMAEIMISVCLTAIALILIFKWIRSFDLPYCILGVVCMVWAFSIYQSNVILYMSGALACFWMLEVKDIRKALGVCIRLILPFLSAYFIYLIINKLFFTSSGYLEESILWGTASVGECLRNIVDHLQKILKGEGVFYSKVYGALIIAMCVIFISDLRNMSRIKLLKWISIAFLFATPIALTVCMGNIPVYRSQMSLGFVQAMLLLFIFDYFSDCPRKLIRTGVMLITVLGMVLVLQQQSYTTLKLYYTDDMRYNDDVEVISRIANDIYEMYGEGEKTVAYIGCRNARLNASCYLPETEGVEYYGLSIMNIGCLYPPYYYYSTNTIIQFGKTIGIDFTLPSQEQLMEARQIAATMAVWPEEGSIIEADGYIIVKISEDSLPAYE